MKLKTNNYYKMIRLMEKNIIKNYVDMRESYYKKISKSKRGQRM